MLPYECLSRVRAFIKIAAGRHEEGPRATRSRFWRVLRLIMSIS